MTIWFTSDPHFGHARICELSGRPFASVDEMNDALVDNWNSRVRPSDWVFALGDMCLGTFSESVKQLARLNGIRVLLPGNHDRVSSLYHGSEAKKREWHDAYTSAGFFVSGEILEMTTLFPEIGKVKLSHFPYAGDSHDEERFKEARPVDDGSWLLHGHVHEAWKVNGRQINVGVDVWDYAPVARETLLEIMMEAA